mmetsp:Transcript_7519/g.23223  ORF Transcript_7519/g.23223 Transcript_7519/m.23223 type:complete len:274 (+) Transcript_7519:1121-1942(+)
MYLRKCPRSKGPRGHGKDEWYSSNARRARAAHPGPGSVRAWCSWNRHLSSHFSRSAALHTEEEEERAESAFIVKASSAWCMVNCFVLAAEGCTQRETRKRRSSSFTPTWTTRPNWATSSLRKRANEATSSTTGASGGERNEPRSDDKMRAVVPSRRLGRWRLERSAIHARAARKTSSFEAPRDTTSSEARSRSWGCGNSPKVAAFSSRSRSAAAHSPAFCAASTRSTKHRPSSRGAAANARAAVTTSARGSSRVVMSMRYWSRARWASARRAS